MQDEILGDEMDTCQVTISVGVASVEEGNIDSPRTLLRAADKALYLAKASGRNRVAVMRGERAVAVVAGLRA